MPHSPAASHPLALLAIRAFIVLFIGGQTAVTVFNDVLPGPTSYLWRMFAIRLPVITTQIERQGRFEPLDWNRHVAYPRKGIDFWNLLPAHLCSVYPEASAVRIERDGERRTLPCSPSNP